MHSRNAVCLAVLYRAGERPQLRTLCMVALEFRVNCKIVLS